MTGRLLIIGEGSKDSKLLHSAVRKETNFVSRLFSKEEASTDNIVKFKPDFVIFGLEEGLTAMKALYAGLKREPATRELAFIAVLSEDELRSSLCPSDFIDIFCRPIRVSECVSRLLLLYKKTNRMSDENLIRSGDLTIDMTRYEVRIKDRKVDLTYTEYALLKFLVTHPEQVFNRDVLLNKVWGYEYYGGVRTVDVHVRRLRSKIEYRSKRYIETVRNIGYKFIHQTHNE